MHPLSGLLYGIPNYVPANPKRHEVDAIKAHIHKDMSMKEVAKVMKTLPIRKEWLSKFQSRYENAKKAFGKSVPTMTVEELRESCANYRHNVYELYAASRIQELKKGNQYWQVKGSRSGIRDYLPSLPVFKILVKKITVHDTSAQHRVYSATDMFEYFNDIQCSNCNTFGSIRIPPQDNKKHHVCPRCKEPDLDIIHPGVRQIRLNF